MENIITATANEIFDNSSDDDEQIFTFIRDYMEVINRYSVSGEWI